MLSTDEIKLFIDEDAASQKKRFARVGERYFDGDHDIRNYRMFYFNDEEQLVEDKTRSNVRIPHPFFKELTEQATQYILSSPEGFVFSDLPELQNELDKYFNSNNEFLNELSELISDCQTKGFAYMYVKKNEEDRLEFTCADSIGVVEVEGRFTDNGKDYVIYWYVTRIDKDGNQIKKIQVWDDQQTWYYVQSEDGEILNDDGASINPRPHILYTLNEGKDFYYDGLGYIPFFRLDNNKKQLSNLKPIKALIDDYDLMASSLSNNLIDYDNPIYMISGFEGDNLDVLQQNLKTKKIVGVAEGGNISVSTIDVPYEARKTKLDLDEKNIYRFGMGLNLSGLKDTSATTNIAIKAAYSLLDLRCNRLEMSIKRFLQKIVSVVLDEINEQNGTGYQKEDVYFEFKHQIMSNEGENVQNEKVNAEKQQVQINTLLGLSNVLNDETIIQQICDVLDLDYEEIKDHLPKDEEKDTNQAQEDLNNVVVNDEQQSEGSSADTS